MDFEDYEDQFAKFSDSYDEGADLEFMISEGMEVNEADFVEQSICTFSKRTKTQLTKLVSNHVLLPVPVARRLPTQDGGPQGQ